MDVRLPDGRIARFPDDMPREEIRAFIQQKFPDQGRPIVQDGRQIGAVNSAPGEPLRIMVDGSPEAVPAPQGGNWLADTAGRLGQSAGATLTGIGQGFTMGAYDELASLLGTPIKAAENLVSGRDRVDGIGDLGGFVARSFMDARKGQQGLVEQAYDNAPVAAAAGDVAGALGLGLLSGGANIVNIAKPTVSGMAGRGALEGGIQGAVSGFNSAEEDSLPGRFMAAAQGSAIGAPIGAITGGVLGGRMASAQRSAVPEVQELADQAGALYEAARKSGVQASPSASKGLADTIEQIASSENVRLPSGKVNQTYPKIAGVLNVFEEYGGTPLDVGQMQAIRRNLQDAAKSIDPGERRIASIMLGEFDDFAEGVAPELAEASNLYWRAKTGELIEEAIDLAGNRSSQYSQSGMENALRTQFRQLNAKIIKGQLKGITPELKEQIARVAEGGPVENFARSVGKFAVRGPVSGMIPTIAGGGGFAAGGPVGAALAAGAVAVPGEIGKRVAEAGTVRNAELASLIARSGGALPAQELDAVAQALLRSGGNSAARFLANY